MVLELNLIYNMDCREGLKLLEDNSIDSIVTDPPYELGFMGKSWDKTGIAYNVELWHECLRVLKPGGHLLAFGGTRTYHRMACAIEDAGFEIRDQIQWIYGSGFPKSMDISKAIDKKLGAEREVIGQRKVTSSDLGQSSGWNYLDTSKGVYNYTIPTTDEAKQWDGWGTALKPANEPIVVARKPLSEKTIAENVLKWGTGGINIDDCRIAYDISDTNPATNPLYRKKNGYKTNYGIDSNPSAYTLKKQEGTMNINNQGRFPANVILDEEAAKMLDEQSGILKSGSNNIRRKEGSFVEHGGLGKAGDIQVSYGDIGGASRFFYCAKASKSERNIGLEDMPLRNNMRVNALRRSEEEKISTMHKNFHPTVKPIKLIEYLIKLVTPPNGVCLDPFEGSGTHALACINLGFNFIGFELNKDYYNIAIARINHAKQHARQISLIE